MHFRKTTANGRGHCRKCGQLIAKGETQVIVWLGWRREPRYHLNCMLEAIFTDFTPMMVRPQKYVDADRQAFEELTHTRRTRSNDWLQTGNTPEGWLTGASIHQQETEAYSRPVDASRVASNLRVQVPTPLARDVQASSTTSSRTRTDLGASTDTRLYIDDEA